MIIFLFATSRTSGIIRFKRKLSCPVDECTAHPLGAKVQRQTREQQPARVISSGQWAACPMLVMEGLG